MKTPLAIRPIFHHLEPRTDTHIFLCVLAYHLLIAIEKTLLDQGIHTSWASLRDHPQNPPGLHRRPAHRQRLFATHPKGRNSRPRHVQQISIRNLRISQHVITPKYTWTQPTNSD